VRRAQQQAARIVDTFHLALLGREMTAAELRALLGLTPPQ